MSSPSEDSVTGFDYISNPFSTIITVCGLIFPVLVGISVLRRGVKTPTDKLICLQVVSSFIHATCTATVKILESMSPDGAQHKDGNCLSSGTCFFLHFAASTNGTVQIFSSAAIVQIRYTCLFNHPRAIKWGYHPKALQTACVINYAPFFVILSSLIPPLSFVPLFLQLCGVMDTNDVLKFIALPMFAPPVFVLFRSCYQSVRILGRSESILAMCMSNQKTAKMGRKQRTINVVDFTASFLIISSLMLHLGIGFMYAIVLSSGVINPTILFPYRCLELVMGDFTNTVIIPFILWIGATYVRDIRRFLNINTSPGFLTRDASWRIEAEMKPIGGVVMKDSFHLQALPGDSKDTTTGTASQSSYPRNQWITDCERAEQSTDEFALPHHHKLKKKERKRIGWIQNDPDTTRHNEHPIPEALQGNRDEEGNNNDKTAEDVNLHREQQEDEVKDFLMPSARRDGRRCERCGSTISSCSSPSSPLFSLPSLSYEDIREEGDSSSYEDDEDMPKLSASGLHLEAYV